MQTQPLVSIVIPCYNGQAYVADAISSALAQTYPYTEVVVVDDGSTDKSRDVIQQFEPKVRTLVLTHQSGNAARNKGWHASNGDYILFLDADDVLLPEKVQRHVEAIFKYAEDPYCDVTVSDYWVTTIANERKIKRVSLVGSSEDPVIFALECPPGISSPLYPRSRLEEVGGFSEGLPCSQEFDLNLRLAATGVRWIPIREALFTLRKREGSVSSSYIHVLDQRQTILARAAEILEARNALTEERKLAFAADMARAARHYMQRGCRAKGIQAWESSLRWHPEGWKTVYQWPARMLCGWFGPLAVERLADWRRRFIAKYG